MMMEVALCQLSCESHFILQIGNMKRIGALLFSSVNTVPLHFIPSPLEKSPLRHYQMRSRPEASLYEAGEQKKNGPIPNYGDKIIWSGLSCFFWYNLWAKISAPLLSVCVAWPLNMASNWDVYSGHVWRPKTWQPVGCKSDHDIELAISLFVILPALSFSPLSSWSQPPHSSSGDSWSSSLNQGPSASLLIST